MSRFYVSADSVKGNTILIKGSEAHHIIDVMRLKRMDRVMTFDGSGKEYAGFIKEIRAGAVTVEITKTRASVSGGHPRITLIQALPKKGRMDFIVEKATELGVSAIMPVVTDRTIPRWEEPKQASEVSRWRRIAREAAKQCARADVPSIGEIAAFTESVKIASRNDLSLIAALGDEADDLKEALRAFKGRDVAVAIGPEGDFTEREIAASAKEGFKLVSLGPRVLRSDTAALSVLSILDYELSTG